MYKLHGCRVTAAAVGRPDLMYAYHRRYMVGRSVCLRRRRAMQASAAAEAAYTVVPSCGGGAETGNGEALRCCLHGCSRLRRRDPQTAGTAEAGRMGERVMRRNVRYNRLVAAAGAVETRILTTFRRQLLPRVQSTVQPAWRVSQRRNWQSPLRKSAIQISSD